MIPAYIGSVGMFNDTKTIFVSPIMNQRMYRLHSELHEQLKEFDATGQNWYRPENWAPHCTLALTKDGDDSAFYKASDWVLHECQKLN